MRTRSQDVWRLVPLCGCLAAACVGQVTGDAPEPGALPGSGEAAKPAPGPSPGVAMPPPPPPRSCALPQAQLWKLTPPQYDKTIAALIPKAPSMASRLAATLPPTPEGFTNDASRLEMTEPHVDRLLASADDLAKAALALPGAVTCLDGRADEAACVRAFVKDFGARAFRRPLTAEEEARYGAFFHGQRASMDARGALTQVVTALLLSPHFLYRMEIGEGAGDAVALGPFERAANLSYLLTDGPPDAELTAAARSGALADKAELRRHAERLLAKPESAPGLTQFVAEHLGYRGVTAAERDPKRFPGWSGARALLARESEAFVEQVLWREDGRFSSLFGGKFSVLNEQLATYYGVSGVTGTSWRRVDLAAHARAGVLTHGSWLGIHARATEPDIVARGRFVREHLLCEAIPPPPPNANAVPPAPDPTLTHRQRIERHSQDPACNGCHHLLDPIGIAFERYDADGRLRAMDNGKPIDASGRMTVGDGSALTFNDGVELVTGLAQHPAAQHCFVRKIYEYSQGRHPAGADACALDDLATRFAASNGDIRSLVLELITHDSFVMRRRS